MQIFAGLMLPFLGTVLGAACVFFVKNEIKPGLQKLLLGFASGVMVAASVWSLIIPAINMSEGMGDLAFIPAAIGFVLGIVFLLAMDKLVPHLHRGSDVPEGRPSRLKKTTMLVFAVTLHNIPEGMAVGVMFAGLLGGNGAVTFAGALALSIGIAIQNFPEGRCYFAAAQKRGERKRQGISLRGDFRRGRACCRRCNNCIYWVNHASAAVCACLCGRSHDLRRRGGTAAGGVGGRTFQYRHNGICRRFSRHDDTGRRFGVTAFGKGLRLRRIKADWSLDLSVKMGFNSYKMFNQR